jgi:hypothetical protein
MITVSEHELNSITFSSNDNMGKWFCSACQQYNRSKLNWHNITIYDTDNENNYKVWICRSCWRDVQRDLRDVKQEDYMNELNHELFYLNERCKHNWNKWLENNYKYYVRKE